MGQEADVSPLSDDDIAALAAGRRDRPFDVLGPHGGWLTIHHPDLTALTDSGDVPPDRVSGDLFRGRVAGAYRLKARSGTGAEWVFEDPYRFGPVLGEGTHRRLWRAPGAPPGTHQAFAGTHPFAVWAANARRVSGIGPFNDRDGRRHPMRPLGGSGIWEIFLPGVGDKAPYRYEILYAHGGVLLRSDPVGFGRQLSEFPFDGSWGYQPVGLYAPTIRFGLPHEFRNPVAAAHEAGLGVLPDWVPGHFPADAHGLVGFDGTALYEHADPREGFHQDWNTLIYNHGRPEVRNVLIANPLYWPKEYHIDGLRVDAVASMPDRDYSRAEGQWIPNRHGGRENLEALAFLKDINIAAHADSPGIITVAEESTARPGVSAPVDAGGPGFGFKWNMAWMNHTLRSMSFDPVHRSPHQDLITFGMTCALSENFVLPVGQDEMVHGKGSMLRKMRRDEWQSFASLRASYGFMWRHPGKKLLFMGCEWGQPEEWNHNGELNWPVAAEPRHQGVQALVRDLNRLYRAAPALCRRDADPEGFRWLATDPAQSTLAWLRLRDAGDPPVVVVCNVTPVPRSGLRIGVPQAGPWREAINTDARVHGGSGMGNLGRVMAEDRPQDGQPASMAVTLPPLSVVILAAGDGFEGEDGS